MSAMDTIDENGKVIVKDGSLKSVQSDHPVWKARNALALPIGEWLYAPENGHDLASYQQAKGSASKIQEFEKSVKFYLASYGSEVSDRFIGRGVLNFRALITRETIDG